MEAVHMQQTLLGIDNWSDNDGQEELPVDYIGRVAKEAYLVPREHWYERPLWLTDPGREGDLRVPVMLQEGIDGPAVSGTPSWLVEPSQGTTILRHVTSESHDRAYELVSDTAILTPGTHPDRTFAPLSQKALLVVSQFSEDSPGIGSQSVQEDDTDMRAHIARVLDAMIGTIIQPQIPTHYSAVRPSPWKLERALVEPGRIVLAGDGAIIETRFRKAMNVRCMDTDILFVLWGDAGYRPSLTITYRSLDTHRRRARKQAMAE